MLYCDIRLWQLQFYWLINKFLGLNPERLTLFMLKSPPAIVGLHTGSAVFECRFFSCCGTACQLNCRFQSNPPTFTPALSWQMYAKLVSSITSITGQTTVVELRAILSRRGSNQPVVHSQCESKQVRTSPEACS